MGCFNTITFTCPECGKGEMEAQTKGGDCSFSEFHHSSVPLDDALDANRHGPFECPNCKAVFEFDLPSGNICLPIRRIYR